MNYFLEIFLLKMLSNVNRAILLKKYGEIKNYLKYMFSLKCYRIFIRHKLLFNAILNNNPLKIKSDCKIKDIEKEL